MTPDLDGIDVDVLADVMAYVLRRAAGDLVTGADTACGCAADEHVSSNACVACESGTYRSPGDDPAGPDTECVSPADPPGDSASDTALLPPPPPRVLVADDDDSSARTRGPDRAAFAAAAVTAAFAILATAR